MPHVVVEYTNNLRADGDIPGLLAKINQVLIDQDGVFPTGGIRSRAIELTDYAIADGKADDAFVHLTLKMARGRDAATKKRACDALFDMVKTHFGALFERRNLALSMEVHDLDEGATYRHNNIHQRFRKA